MATPPPAGIYVPVPTFFASKASPSYDAVSPPLDIDTQGAHAVYLAKSGITGLVLLGSTGESVHLHPRERRILFAGVRAALDAAGFPGFPLIAGTATSSIAETVEQLVEAKDAGMQYGMVLAPGYNAGVTSQDGLVDWFTAVADRSPIPILVYHFPGVSNMVKLTAPTFVSIASHANVVGAKLSHGDVSALTQITLNPAIDGAKFHVFTGLGQQLMPVVSVGAVGAIDASAGFFPKTLVRLLQLAGKEQPTQEARKEARALQFTVSCMEELVVAHGIPGIKEAISRLRGFGDVDGTRAPLKGGLAGRGDDWAKWKGVMDAVEAVEQTL